MTKKYVLIPVVNGRDLPVKYVSTFAEAARQMDKILDRYGLQVADEVVYGNNDVRFKCTQYRTWIRICAVC